VAVVVVAAVAWVRLVLREILVHRVQLGRLGLLEAVVAAAVWVRLVLREILERKDHRVYRVQLGRLGLLEAVVVAAVLHLSQVVLLAL
jgi:hypothetical protein